MEMVPRIYFKETPTYCLIHPHKLSIAPVDKPFSDGEMGSTEERMTCDLELMLDPSLLE